MKPSSILLCLALACAAAVLAAAAITDGLLPNGDFEQGPRQSDMNGTQVIGRYAIPGWQISGFVEYIKSGQKQGDMSLVVPQGAFAVRLGNEASITQTLNVTPSTVYSITLNAARTCAQQERLNISAGVENDVFPIQTLYSSNGWDAYAWAFQSQSSTVDLTIHNPGMEDDPACGPLIDAVAIRTLYNPQRTSQNLLKNGDFEEGPYIVPNTTTGVLVPPYLQDRHSPLPGWLVVSLRAVKFIDAPHFKVPRGQRAIEIVGGRESAIGQVVRTIPGKLYTLAFSVGDSGDSCVGSMLLEAFGGTSAMRVPYESSGTGGFKRFELQFTANATRSSVMFYSSFYHLSRDGSLCGPVIDDVRLLSVRAR